MKQQINLYHDCLRKSHTKPVIFKYFYALGFLISLMLIYNVYLALEVRDLKDKNINTLLQLQSAKTHVQLLQAKYPKKQINKLLQQKLTQSQDMQTSLARVISLLTDKDSDQSQGFSRYFSAFARQSVNGLWLTKITVNAHSNNILLYGSTNNPKTLPTLLHQLQQEPVFKGKVFAKLQMQQAEESNTLVNFTISTSTETPKEKEKTNG